jgi:two-component system, NtrC family, sensor kinase
MKKVKSDDYFMNWKFLIDEMSLKGQSIGFGIFSLDGNLLYANAAMCYYLGTDSVHKAPKNSFINPTFSTFAETVPKLNKEKIFEGLLTIGNLDDENYILPSKVLRKDDQIMIYAEVDVPQMFEDNKKMVQLNREVNNLQKQLIIEKKILQNTLTELKETQQMLIQSEKMNALGKLVAGVAHELNNPISFVYSNIFSLEEYMSEVFKCYGEIEELIHKSNNPELIGAANDIGSQNEIKFLHEDILELTKESRNGIERVKKIVEDLVKFSRLDESEIKVVDLVENIRSSVAIARSEIINKKIHYVYDGPSWLQIECYPGQLNQAILNILINAVYAVDVDGHIVLSVREVDGNVVVSVKDDGSGIPSEIKARIFDPFFTTKPVGSGTGLGLSITYKMIHDLHKGSIEVVSEPGQGTNMILTIPGKIR